MKMRNVAEGGIVGTCAISARGERGVILLVVLGMLQLLTLVGLTFVEFASHGGPVDAIERVEQDIQRAQAALTALLENPDDADRQESALVSVDHALRESSAITDGSETSLVSAQSPSLNRTTSPRRRRTVSALDTAAGDMRSRFAS